MVQDDYELLPHQLLQDLKYDVEALKKKLTQPDAKAEELILEIESLKDSIHELTSVFQRALEQTKEEDAGKLLKAINEKLDAAISQNETIAKGMIAISDKVDDFTKARIPSAPAATSLPSRPMQHTMGLPPLPGSRVAPPPQLEPRSPLSEAEDLPPPPPGKKRVGLFR